MIRSRYRSYGRPRRRYKRSFRRRFVRRIVKRIFRGVSTYKFQKLKRRYRRISKKYKLLSMPVLSLDDMDDREQPHATSATPAGMVSAVTDNAGHKRYRLTDQAPQPAASFYN